jgi:uncharacterized membrane protein
MDDGHRRLRNVLMEATVIFRFAILDFRLSMDDGHRRLRNVLLEATVIFRFAILDFRLSMDDGHRRLRNVLMEATVIARISSTSAIRDSRRAWGTMPVSTNSSSQ